jgi:hypothetical protein
MFIDTLSSYTSPLAYSNWAKLAERTNQADPFCCTPTWQLSYHEAFSPSRRLYIKEGNNGIIAFTEKVFQSGEVYLTPIEPLWLFGNPLLGDDSIELLCEALSDFETTCKPCFPKIAISGIRPRGVLYSRLNTVFGAKFTLAHHSSGIQCAASLAGGLDGYLSRRSGEHRHKLKIILKRSVDKNICFERVTPSPALDHESIYSRMLTVERTSWKGINQCGMTEEPAKSFYGIMLKWLIISNSARVIFAKHEDKDIGFIFGGMSADIYRGQQFSFDEQWKEYSIGNLLQLEQIKWLCETNARRYDMGPLLGPRMGYKTHWTEKKFNMETWVLGKK